MEGYSDIHSVCVLAGAHPLLQPAGLQQQPVISHLLRTLLACTFTAE